MKTDLISKATKLFYNSKATLKKHSPEILLIAGITGTVVTTVIACKKTLKAKEVIDEHKDTVKIVKVCLEDSTKDYTQEDANKDLTIMYTQTGVKLLKLYAPAIGLGALSISAIISSHKIMRNRVGAIAAAYAIVDRSFKNYRSNVVDRFGKTVDNELRYNIKAETIKTKDENGKSVKKDVETIDGDNELLSHSDYARFFDASCSNHTKDPEFNLMYLRHQQAYCNELLKSRGYMFLNEVYDILDIPRTKAGQSVGWLYNKDSEKALGDNYIDFGLYDSKNEAARRFVNGTEYNVLLDFNVDGVIINNIGFGRI